MRAHVRRLTTKETYNHAPQRLASIEFVISAADRMQTHSFANLAGSKPEPIVSWDQAVSLHFHPEELAEQYDEAIVKLREVLESGAVDSKRITEDLRSLLATLEDAKSSSFVNQRLQMITLKQWISAVGKVSARKIPGISFIFEVIEELDKSLETTNEQILNEVRQQATARARAWNQVIEHQPDSIPPTLAAPASPEDSHEEHASSSKET